MASRLLVCVIVSTIVVLFNGHCTFASSGSSELFEPAESRTVRVMVRKDFKLQPDGSYKEVSSQNKKKIDVASPRMESAGSENVESYSFVPYYAGASRRHASPYNLDFTVDDVRDVMRQAGLSSVQQNRAEPSSHSYVRIAGLNHTAAASSPVRTRAVQFEIKKAESPSYYDYSGNPSSGYSVPNSIQEVMRNKPGASVQNDHYYTPKDQYYYDNAGPTAGYPSYDGPESGYGTPAPEGYTSPAPNYGPPSTQFEPINVTPVPSYGLPHFHSVEPVKSVLQTPLPGPGAVVNTLQGIAHTGAGHVSSILHQTGQVGNQLFQTGGQVLQQVGQQKAQKARIIGQTLIQAPARFSQVLRNKAQLATGLVDSGTRAFGSVLNIKTHAVNQASDLLAAKGKAANAIIRASGGTAANLIRAKGRGLANLINTGGVATAAILNHKGNAVARIADVLGNIGAQVHVPVLPSLRLTHPTVSTLNHGGWSSTAGYDAGIVGGYSENLDSYAPARMYDEEQLQEALKSVVSNPASSYGQPPSESSAKLTSAFKSLYDTFKSNQNEQVGSYSTNIQATAKPETESISQSAAAIGDSLTKVTQVLNNVADAINWLSPQKDKNM